MCDESLSFHPCSVTEAVKIKGNMREADVMLLCVNSFDVVCIDMGQLNCVCVCSHMDICDSFNMIVHHACKTNICKNESD